MCPERLQREREDRVDLTACKGRWPPLLVTGFPITASWFGKKALTVRQSEASLSLILLKSLARKKKSNFCQYVLQTFSSIGDLKDIQGADLLSSVFRVVMVYPQNSLCFFSGFFISLLAALKFIKYSWWSVREEHVFWFEPGTRNGKTASLLNVKPKGTSTPRISIPRAGQCYDRHSHLRDWNINFLTQNCQNTYAVSSEFGEERKVMLSSRNPATGHFWTSFMSVSYCCQPSS